MNDGLIDTNVFVHAYMSDTHTDDCKRFLAALSRGDARAHLEGIVVHELTYVFPRVIKQFNRESVADLLLNVLEWPGIHCDDKALFAETLTRWKLTPGLSFADALLAARAIAQGIPVFTKNIRELVRQGAMVPDPLMGD
jgi:predicted nucleic acid-binding protein